MCLFYFVTQSVLLLLQPLWSTLIEIHPNLAYKPKVYGALQFGIRDNVRIPRGYLSFESLETRGSGAFSVLTSAVFGSLLRMDSASCLRYALCRYMARSQDVILNDDFLKRALSAIKLHFDGGDVDG